MGVYKGGSSKIKEISARRSGNNEGVLPGNTPSGERRPERSGYAERSVMAQKERRAKATTNTRFLDTQMTQTDKVIDATHAKIEKNNQDLRGEHLPAGQLGLIPAAKSARNAHIDAIKDSEAAKQTFANTASALAQAERFNVSANKDAESAIKGLDSAQANHNAAQAALAKNPADSAAQAAAAKAQLELNGAITIKLAADATLAATATVLTASQVANAVARKNAIDAEKHAEKLGSIAQARESQIAGIQKENEALVTRAELHENLKTAIAGNINLSRESREAHVLTRDKLKDEIDQAKKEEKKTQDALACNDALCVLNSASSV